MPKLPPKKGKRIDRINTLLIDGNALFKRGYHGSHDAYNKEGQHIGGLYQFITVLKKLLSEDVYHRVYVFWDGEFSGKLRYNKYKDYKSDRGKNYESGTKPEDMDEKLQQYMVKEYLYHLSIRQIEDDVVEADDYIAFYSNNKADNEDVTICTSDRDICQLVNDNIKIYLCDKKIYLTKGNYNEHFSHHYTNVALIKTISGDNSDTINGIKGVKEATLTKHFPQITERSVELSEILSDAEKIQEGRLLKKKKPLKALDNIINSVTEGIQGSKIYEINDELVNLKKPKMTEKSIIHFYDIIDTPLSDDRSIKDVYRMVKRDSLDDIIRSYYMSDYFLPFKKLIDRDHNKI